MIAVPTIMSSFTGKQRTLNFILTLVQYSTLFAFIILTPKIANGWFWLSIEICGITLAIWAILVMHNSKLNITPLPRKGATIVTCGPYRFIRHPMYLSLVLSLTPLIITHYNRINTIILAVLFVNLIFKMLFEESVLAHYFEGYESYSMGTKRIIPFIW